MDDRDAALKFYQDQGIAEMKSVKKAIEVADTRLKWHGTFHQDIKEFLEKSINENWTSGLFSFFDWSPELIPYSSYVYLSFYFVKPQIKHSSLSVLLIYFHHDQTVE